MKIFENETRKEKLVEFCRSSRRWISRFSMWKIAANLIRNENWRRNSKGSHFKIIRSVCWGISEKRRFLRRCEFSPTPTEKSKESDTCLFLFSQTNSNWNEVFDRWHLMIFIRSIFQFILFSVSPSQLWFSIFDLSQNKFLFDYWQLWKSRHGFVCSN